VKVLLEEIVKHHATARYRRAQLGSFDAPVEMLPVLLPVLQDGFTLVMDDNDGDHNNSRRSLMVANVRVAAISRYSAGRGVDQGYIGLIIDLIDPALYKALEEDQDAPADYNEFCKLEDIGP
jgi:hypothetical protein